MFVVVFLLFRLLQPRASSTLTQAPNFRLTSFDLRVISPDGDVFRAISSHPDLLSGFTISDRLVRPNRHRRRGHDFASLALVLNNDFSDNNAANTH